MDMTEIPHEVIRGPAAEVARLEGDLAKAEAEAEAAKAKVQAAKDEDVDRNALSRRQKKRDKLALQSREAKEAAEEAQISLEGAKKALAEAKADLDRIREANKAQLIAAERKDLPKASEEMLKGLELAKSGLTKMKATKKRIILLERGRDGVPEGFRVPVVQGRGDKRIILSGEGGEETVGVEKLIEVLSIFARDPEAEPTRSPQMRVYEEGTVVVPREPMLESLARPEVA